jgi:rod shape-determining protein MreC
MLDTFSRQRPWTLLAGVVLAQVLLLAFQIKRERDVRLIRYWAVEFLTPAERAGTWSFSKVGGIWTNYIGLRDAHSENQKLRSEIENLRLRNWQLESKAAEAQRLSVLLNFRDAHPEAPMLAAQVIGASADPTSHTLFINRGERDHVRRNLPVITPDGVVGKIVEVFPSSAQVLLLNDKDSGVGAIFAGTRAHGVIRGTGDPGPRMDYVSKDVEVQPGQQILTSGDDRIFPKDYPIGTVESSTPGDPFLVIRVKVAARLDRLEEVIILLTQQELAPKKTEEASTASAAQQAVARPSSVTAKNPAVTSSKAVAHKPPAPKPAPGAAQPQAIGDASSSGNSPANPPASAPAPPQ